jgi:sporadic carbohydrate cluster 2OG-Fe(II) oxygenase
MARQQGAAMPIVEGFFTREELELGGDFTSNGYVIREVENRPALDALRAKLVALACRHLGCEPPADDGKFLDSIHERVKPQNLNELRLALYRGLNELPWLRPTYFALGRSVIERLVGNELAMQNRVNLSIQMPNDDSSLLDIHADVYGGETPFQVVQWLPLVDCFETKSMFILPYPKNERVHKRLHEIGEGGMSALYDEVKDDVVWLTVPYGKVLVFSPNCLHGNVVNRATTTRWTMNTRFTGLFTPYTSYEKKLGSYYLPITVRAVSRVGMNYEEPSGFKE